MSIESQFAPTPAHGAAWNVILQRVVPGLCSTAEILAPELQKLEAIKQWAMGQDAPVRTAYLWALPRVEEACRNVFAQYENRRRILEAAEKLPKPPEEGAEPPVQTGET